MATGQKEYGLLQQVSHFFMQKHKREQNQQNYKQHPKTVKIYTIGMEEVVFLRVFQQSTFMKWEGSEIKSDFQKWL